MKQVITNQIPLQPLFEISFKCVEGTTISLPLADVVCLQGIPQSPVEALVMLPLMLDLNMINSPTVGGTSQNNILYILSKPKYL